MNNIEELMRELVKSSVVLKHKLYRRDDFASASPEGTGGAAHLSPRLPAVQSGCCWQRGACASQIRLPARKAAKGASSPS